MATLPRAELPVASRHRLWRLLQAAAVAALVAVLVACALLPERALPFLWSGLIPLLPSLFLVHPGLWRNVCPLATLGMGTDEKPVPAGPTSLFVAVAVLVALIPLRPLGLETGALASGGLLAGAAAAALIGRARPRKAGFCNGWCPVLPVERLYGQRPLIQLENPRCPSCTVCTPRGCLDLSPSAATAQMLGYGRKGHRWLLSGLGAFGAAFPGVVVAFYLLPPEPSPVQAYGQVILWGAASWVAAGATVLLTRARWQVALPSFAALAAGAFQWFALPGVAEAWGIPGAGMALRGAGLLLVTVWWFGALR